MKTFYSAQDIEALAAQGVRELVVDENSVLTDLARDMAAQLGIKLVAPGRPAGRRQRSRPEGGRAVGSQAQGMPARSVVRQPGRERCRRSREALPATAR